MWIGTRQQSDPKVSKEQYWFYCEKNCITFKKPFIFSLFKRLKTVHAILSNKKSTLQIWSLFHLCKETTNIKHSFSCVCQETLMTTLMTLKNIPSCFPIRNYLLRERAWGSKVCFSSLSTKKIVINFQAIVTWKTVLVMLIFFFNLYIKTIFYQQNFCCLCCLLSLLIFRNSKP